MSKVEMKLELVAVPVTDVDRAKRFYVEQAGFVADHDHKVSDEIRFVQLTPPGSACSIAIGRGVATTEPGVGPGAPARRRGHRGGARGARRGRDRGQRRPGLPVGPVRLLRRPRRQRLGRAGDRGAVAVRSPTTSGAFPQDMRERRALPRSEQRFPTSGDGDDTFEVGFNTGVRGARLRRRARPRRSSAGTGTAIGSPDGAARRGPDGDGGGDAAAARDGRAVPVGALHRARRRGRARASRGRRTRPPMSSPQPTAGGGSRSRSSPSSPA